MEITKIYLLHFIGLLLVLGGSSGCTSLARNPLPLDYQNSAIIPGIQDVRALSGLDNQAFEDDVLFSERQYRKYRGLPATAKLDLDLLVISGGADYGAFGAGFLNGWTQSGNRRDFKLVTGVSTGALIAPFAFIGPDYDDELKEAYTTVSANDIFTPRGLSALWDEAFADTAPLARLIELYYDEALLLRVADAHEQGRRLWIATTNLDADRLVIWNMGVIARSGHPNALQLFRQVILASTSIPGAFPPVLIDVEVAGKTFDEMHVDGGVKAQLFINAETLNLARLQKRYSANVAERPNWRIFIIRNAQVGPDPQQIPRKVADITGRAFTSLIKSQGRSDLERIYIMARERGIDFNWISLPIEYKPETLVRFDKSEMNRMYELGYELGLKGNAWRKRPPGFGHN